MNVHMFTHVQDFASTPDMTFEQAAIKCKR